MATVGFIGTGNMGGALARAAARSAETTRLLLANRTREKAERLALELGAEAADNRRVAEEAEVLFLAVKPQYLEGMLDGIREVLEGRRDRFVVVSMIAGRDLASLERLLGGAPVVRIMPNLPVSVGAGVTLLTASDSVTPEEKARVKALLAASGHIEELDERLFDAASGVTGCGPAFAAMFIDALADGAVTCGLPRRAALTLSALMLKGTAELLLETDEHPGSLKDRVCSPAGSTIEGVRRLEQGAFRADVCEAVLAAFHKEF